MAQNLFSRRRQTKRKQKGKRHNNEFFEESGDVSLIRRCEVTKLSHEGRGIAKYKGKTQFIEGALIGETVSAKLLNSANTYDELQVMEVLVASPDRVEPFCQHFSLCGGCSLQAMMPAAQLKHKAGVLEEQLAHFGQIESSQTLDSISSDSQHYRSKARLGVYYDSSLDRLIIGFREKQSKRLTDIEDCPILVESIGRLVPSLRTLCQGLQNARHITHIELAASASEQAMVIRHMKPFSEQDKAALLDFSSEQSVRVFLQAEAGQQAKELVPGAKDMSYSLKISGEKDLTLAFHPQDFTQVNTRVNQSLIDLALQQLDLKEDDKVLDLFCGLGNFTLPIALKCQSVIGVEGSEQMVDKASINAKANAIENASFYSADLHADFRHQSWAKHNFNKILIDPPRAGALVVANYLQHFNAERIVYISCNPATLSRDAGVLAAHGYRLEASGVIDMFPNTAHIESIAVFVRQAK